MSAPDYPLLCIGGPLHGETAPPELRHLPRFHWAVQPRSLSEPEEISSATYQQDQVAILIAGRRALATVYLFEPLLADMEGISRLLNGPEELGRKLFMRFAHTIVQWPETRMGL